MAGAACLRQNRRIRVIMGVGWIVTEIGSQLIVKEDRRTHEEYGLMLKQTDRRTLQGFQ